MFWHKGIIYLRLRLILSPTNGINNEINILCGNTFKLQLTKDHL